MPIKIKNLHSVYNEGTVFEKKALENINIEINNGEFIGLIGHTGSGKSTLIQHLNSLIKPTEGEITIDGININENKKIIKENRQNVGLVFQYPEHQLFETTVYEDVAFGAKKMGMDKNEIDKNVRESLEIVGIGEELYEKSPFEISGGQKRKVALAGVLVMKPKILVLDEPTAGLDPKSRKAVLENIKEMQNKLKITIILVSHSMEDVAKYADRLIVMEKGKIVYFDKPKEIFKNEKRLEEIGLAIPKIKKLINRLNEKGYKIEEDFNNIDELVNYLERKMR